MSGPTKLLSHLPIDKALTPAVTTGHSRVPYNILEEGDILLVRIDGIIGHGGYWAASEYDVICAYMKDRR